MYLWHAQKLFTVYDLKMKSYCGIEHETLCTVNY